MLRKHFNFGFLFLSFTLNFVGRSLLGVNACESVIGLFNFRFSSTSPQPQLSDFLIYYMWTIYYLFFFGKRTINFLTFVLFDRFLTFSFGVILLYPCFFSGHWVWYPLSSWPLNLMVFNHNRLVNLSWYRLPERLVNIY